MSQFHELEITAERFADEITGSRVRNIELISESKILLHLENGERLFVAAIETENDVAELIHQLQFTQEVMS